MPTEGVDPEDATRCAKCVRVFFGQVRRSSFALMEDRQHFIDGVAGFLLNASGIES